MATLTLKEAGAHFGQRIPAKLRRASVAALQSLALRGVQIVVTELIPSRVPQPVDRGLYRAGWKAHPTEDGAVIENLEPHAAFIEHGVRASSVKVGRKMIAALAEWAARHGFEEPERAAWAIARKMQERGIWGGKGLGIHALLNWRLRVELAKIGRDINAEMQKRGL